jgi:hypothetical protein
MAAGDAERVLNLLAAAIDPVTGKLGVKADLQVGNLDVGTVDQGAATAGAAWKVTDATLHADLVALQAAIAAGEPTDVVDRVGRILGHVTVDAATIAALTDGTQRVGGTVDISDRAGRVNGKVTADDGGIASVGALGDAEVAGAGNASAIAVLKRLRTLLNGGLPGALAANGGLKVEGVAGGVAQPISAGTGAGALQVQGGAAVAAAAAGNPVRNGVADAGGTMRDLAVASTTQGSNPATGVLEIAPLMWRNTNDYRVMSTADSQNDAAPGTNLLGSVYYLWNGASWDRPRGDTTKTGVQAVAAFPGTTTAANILNGFQSFTSTTGATTLITVPAGREWAGEVGASCTAAEVGAGTAAAQARAVFAVAGTGVTPAAGTVFAVEARAGANVATGTVGSQAANANRMKLRVIAPVGNSVTITVASTNAGTNATVDAYASGELL